jgi:hypothetical protein
VPSVNIAFLAGIGADMNDALHLRQECVNVFGIERPANGFGNVARVCAPLDGVKSPSAVK